MIESVKVIGARGRVGSAVSARLAERGVRLDDPAPAARPSLRSRPRDRGASQVELAAGPWVAHVSGATTLAALAPSRAAVLAAPAADVHPSPRPRAARRRLGRADGRDRRGTRGRAGACRRSSASGRSSSPTRAGRSTTQALRSRRTTSSRSVGSRAALLETRRRATRGTRPADAPGHRERLRADGADRARRLGDGGAASRGDPRRSPRARIALRRCSRRRTSAMHAEVSGMNVSRTVADVRAALAPLRRGHDRARSDDGSAPRRPSRAARRRARGVRHRRDEPLRQPDSVRRRRPTSTGYPRDEAGDLAIAAAAGVDVVFAPSAAEMYPPGYQTWVEVSELGAILEGVQRPGHFRGVATVCLKLFTIVRPDLAFYGQKDAQQVEVLRRMILRPRARARAQGRRDGARPRRSRAVLAQRAPDARATRAGPRAPSGARDRRSGDARPSFCAMRGSTSTTSRSRRSIPLSSPAPSASAPPA